MAYCCLGGIFRPQVLDPCTGSTRSLRDGEYLRIGDTTVGTTLVTITVSTTLYGNTEVFADATAGALTVTLPEGVEGMLVAVKKIDATGYIVTVEGYGSETIDGELNAEIGDQYATLTIRFHNGEWWIM